MQLATRVPRQSPCIFCIFRSASSFSTTAAAPSASRRLRRRSSRSKYHAIYDPLAELELNDSPPPRPASSQRSDDFLYSRPSKLFKSSRQKPTRFRDEDQSFAPGESFPRKGFTRFGLSPSKGLSTRDPASRDNLHLIDRAIARLQLRLHLDPSLAKLQLELHVLEERFRKFKNRIQNLRRRGDTSDPLLKRLNLACRSSDFSAVYVILKIGLFRDIIIATTSNQALAEQQRVANLAYPSEWFPATRGMQREFHLHVGPTNSGKTYHALKRLEQAENGLYAGPLRLLAHEVYLRLNASGRRCNLITGDDRRTADDNPEAPMVSCTVEMVPLNWKMDVAVIDEIQMLGSEDRGWAWTQAVLGVQAREMHVCGEERAVPIMQELAALCGDKLHIHRYERLSPLRMMSKSFDGDINKLKKGDCLVCFSIVLIHALRQLIEKTLQVKVAVIYGSLPPETRAQQARLFNDPESGYDILIASDAVGMGLNLSIKRIIFHTSSKLLGRERVPLKNHEIKQIAGRAGRFSTAEQDMKKSISEVDLDDEAVPATSPPTKQLGLVSTLERSDHVRIRRGMEANNDPITTAGIFPPAYIIERFATLLPQGTPFSFLLLRLYELAEMTSRFHLCDLRQNVAIADAIDPVESLRPSDRLIFCSSPCDPRKKGEAELIRAYAELVAEHRQSTILDVPELNLDLLNDDYTVTRDYLREIEALHKGVVVWLWLSYRYEAVFLKRDLATHVKELVEKRIEDMLAKLSFDYDKMMVHNESDSDAVLDHDSTEDGADSAETEVETADSGIIRHGPAQPTESPEDWLPYADKVTHDTATSKARAGAAP